MPRLPNVGDDSGTWGTVLNEYLGVSHAPDGKLIFDTWADDASRPAAPTTNQVGFNQTTEVIEQYDGASWVTLVGGIQDNTIDPTKLNAQSEMYENFLHRANGYTIEKTGTSPAIGNPFIVHRTPSGVSPLYVDNGAIRPDNCLVYLGGENTEVVKSLTLEWEWFPTTSPTGINFQGITFAFAANPLLAVNGANTGILLPFKMLHLSCQQAAGQFQWGISDSTTNAASFSAFASPAATTDWGYGGLNNYLPSNIRNFVTIRLSGDTVWITGLGYTKIFKDPRVAEGGIGKWWWIEWSGQSTYTAQMKIHRFWINSPHLDLAPGVNQPFSELLAQLSSGGNVTLPQKISLMYNQAAFPNGDPDGTEALAAASSIGAVRFVAKPYVDHSKFEVGHHVYYQTTAVSSSVNASNQTLGTGVSFFALTNPGKREDVIFSGYFANNSNTKRIRLFWLGTTIFDSGDLTTSDKEWELRLTRVYYTATPYNMNFTFTISGQNPILRFYSSTYSGGAVSVLQASGVAAGDVVLRSADGIKYTINT